MGDADGEAQRSHRPLPARPGRSWSAGGAAVRFLGWGAGPGRLHELRPTSRRTDLRCLDRRADDPLWRRLGRRARANGPGGRGRAQHRCPPVTRYRLGADRLRPRGAGQPRRYARAGRLGSDRGRRPRCAAPRRGPAGPHLQPWARRPARVRSRDSAPAGRLRSPGDDGPMTGPRQRFGVLLMTYGSPSSLDDVGRYMTAVRNGRQPEPELLAEFRRRYEVIGGSPLIDITRAQAAALEQRLGGAAVV